MFRMKKIIYSVLLASLLVLGLTSCDLLANFGETYEVYVSELSNNDFWESTDLHFGDGEYSAGSLESDKFYSFDDFMDFFDPEMKSYTEMGLSLFLRDHGFGSEEAKKALDVFLDPSMTHSYIIFRTGPKVTVLFK